MWRGVRGWVVCVHVQEENARGGKRHQAATPDGVFLDTATQPLLLIATDRTPSLTLMHAVSNMAFQKHTNKFIGGLHLVYFTCYIYY